MRHIFNLQPNLTLLNKHGYLNLNEQQLIEAIGKGEGEQVEIDAIWQANQRKQVEQAFKIICTGYGLTDQYDTLLYIILVESNHADAKLQYVHQAYENYKRCKELAEWFCLTDPANKNKLTGLKLLSNKGTVQLQDEMLVNWITGLVERAIVNLDFNPSELGDELFDFVVDKDGSVAHKGRQLNYTRIAQIATRTIRKPGIRTRNEHLAAFLFRVRAYLEDETRLKSTENATSPAEQLEFLFRVADMMDWIKEDDFEADRKDYMHTLMTNALRNN